MRKVKDVWLGDSARDLSEKVIANAEETEGHHSPYFLSSEFGDAHYTLSVPEPGVLKFEYDFAL